MNAKDVIKASLSRTQGMLKNSVSDLSDADLLVRPVPGANHIAWQIGHLVRAEANFLGNNFPGTAAAELPLGFAERHSKEAAKADDGFATKAEYLDLFGKVRSATLAALEAMPDTDLDRPTAGPIAALAPTVGQALAFTGIHTMMHTGQFSVVRRKLGKPILF